MLTFSRKYCKYNLHFFFDFENFGKNVNNLFPRILLTTIPVSLVASTLCVDLVEAHFLFFHKLFKNKLKKDLFFLISLCYLKFIETQNYQRRNRIMIILFSLISRRPSKYFNLPIPSQVLFS